MFLHILSYIREIDDGLDAEIDQPLWLANAAQLEYLGTANATGTQYYFSKSLHRISTSVYDERDA